MSRKLIDVTGTINNGMWNYGAVLSLIMLVFILAMEVFSDKKEDSPANDGGLI